MSIRILLVDDEPAVTQALQRTIHALRPTWEVTCEDRCTAAWERMQHEEFDALVVDIWMPGMSGLELLERKRSDRRTFPIPAVVLTGMEHRRLEMRAREAGASALMSKPVEAGRVVKMLEQVLSQNAPPAAPATGPLTPTAMEEGGVS